MNSFTDTFSVPPASSGLPPNLSVSYQYEQSRDLKAQVKNESFRALVSQYNYLNDEAGHRNQRTDTIGTGSAILSSVGYNVRSEVTSAIFGTQSHSYNYDDIGNREICSVGSVSQIYAANELNQYTSISSVPSGAPRKLGRANKLKGVCLMK